MRKILSIARYDARMSLRGWRFWLLLALMAAISWFARRDYLLAIEAGRYLHAAFAFQHPSFWLMMSVILLGAVSLGLDTCGRLRRNGMDRILFPLPFSSMQLTWGRFLGVMAVLLPLSAAGVFSLALWQWMFGHGSVVWQPFALAYLFLVLPLAVPAAALAIMFRTFFKHDFAALLFGGALSMGLWWIGRRAGLVLDIPALLDALENASPSIGARVEASAHFRPILAHAAASLLALYLSPLYLRRRVPQGWGFVRRDGPRVFGVSSLLRAVSALRPDRGLEWTHRAVLLSLVVVCAAGIIRAAERYQESVSIARERAIFAEINRSGETPPQTARVVHYAIHIDSRPESRVDFRAETRLRFPEDADRLVLELDPRYRVGHIYLNGAKHPHNRRLERLEVIPRDPWKAGGEAALAVEYRWDAHTAASYAVPPGQWYPKPWRKTQTENRRFIALEDNLFTAELRLDLRPGQKGVFAGELREAEDRPGEGRRETWRTAHPVNAMEVYWGFYNQVSEERPGYTARFYHLPGHEYQARVFLEEMKEQEEFVIEKLGRYPFPELVLAEIPYSHDAYRFEDRLWRTAGKPPAPDLSMPGVVRVPENMLVYMHEGIWMLERLDRDPEAIAFYPMLEPTLDYLHDHFYQEYIASYFEDALNPSGELAFWLGDHLSSYARKLLERNSWRRRRQLEYDVGTSPSLPLVAAQRDNLLELHRSGQYPQLENVRGEGLFRMLHHLLGEDRWWEFMSALFEEYRFKELPVSEFLERAEQWHGEPLDWFWEQWLWGTALPEYEIIHAEARVSREPGLGGRGEIAYNVEVRVKNHGTGRMKVPIFVETEMDYIFRGLWLGGGEEDTLRLKVPHRPLFAAVDPEHWVVQVPHFDERRNRRIRSEKRFYIPGDDRSEGTRRRRPERRRW